MAVFIGEVGKKIQITFGVDITGATVKYLVLKPSGTPVSWDATVDNATLGITSYTTADANDLNEEGNFQITPEVSFADPVRKYYGTVVEFPVKSLYT